MKTAEFHQRIFENHENNIISCDNQHNYESPRIPRDNHENHEILRISLDNYNKILKILKFHCIITKIMKTI